MKKIINKTKNKLENRGNSSSIDFASMTYAQTKYITPLKKFSTKKSIINKYIRTSTYIQICECMCYVSVYVTRNSYVFIITQSLLD